MNLEEIINKIKEYMILESNNTGIIDMILAVALSIELDRPIWIMLIAPPSSGKTVLLEILSSLEGIHTLYTLTPRTLFSGHPSAQGGYMNREVKEKGILLFPDFTTVLKLNSKSRNEIFNQLRVIFDGRAGLGTGIDTGRIRIWEGKVAVLSLVTQAIEKIKETTTDLGERFLYFRYFPKEKEYSSFRHFKTNEDIKSQLPQIVKNFIESKKELVTQIDINDNIREKIFYLAKFISIGRATVEREGYRRGIENIHKPEEPYRVMNLLLNSYKSLYAINNNSERSFVTLRNIAMSSIPYIRLQVLGAIHLVGSESVSMEEIQNKLSKLSDTKVRRTVEDLVAQDILRQFADKKENKYYYSISEKFKKYWGVVLGKV